MCDTKHGNLEDAIKSLQVAHIKFESERKEDLDKIYAKLEKFGDRLPVWATMLIGFLMMICGGAISHLWK